MTRRPIFGLILLATAALATSACGGGPGFTIRTQIGLPNPFGPPTLVDQPSVGVAGKRLVDLSGASGTQTSFTGRSGSNARLSLPNARVPAVWAFASTGFPCIGMTPSTVRVSRGSTVSLLCLTGIAVAASMAPSPTAYSVNSPPTTTSLSGYGIQTTYGMPFVEYYDPFTGGLEATVRATKVYTNPTSGAQTVVVATPRLTESYYGSMAILIRNADASAAPGDCAGTAVMAVSGGQSYLQAPPADPCTVGGCA